ncbi:hypothetical protein J0A67_05170 [Algoriphagus aestuariicola]|uniref:Gliding motility-associated lipoprotein GldH n=1 Tax=Algoriphagus aestuariicola TaxID=1852016 RepID=A0ABS3BMF2_9BACT|nr:hypothetical protein [Algoriphagus aestuariicola]MBN7800240.1 hypothetical protein [Algoriphagus aestuariicola]
MKVISTKRVVHLAPFSVILFLVTFCNGCKNKIDFPQSDATPPTYKWVVQVQNNNNDQFEFTTTGQQLSLNKNYNYRVFFIAYDYNGGVKSVSLKGEGLTACPRSNVANIGSVSYNDNAVLWPDVDGQVQTSAFRLATFDISCRYLQGSIFPQAFTGPGGKVVLMGNAENYHGGQTTSILSIINIP